MTAEQTTFIKAKFEGVWLLDSSENLDAFLKAIGLNKTERKLGIAAKPTCEIRVDGDDITIASGTEHGSRSETFRLNREYETSYHGEKAMVMSTLEDGKLITKATSIGSQTAIPTVIRDVTGEQMCFQLVVGDVICKRYYYRSSRM